MTLKAMNLLNAAVTMKENFYTNINRTLENLCCTGCRVSRLNGEVVYTLIVLYYANVAFVQNTGRLPIHMHTHIHSHTQLDSMAQQMLNTPTQIYPHFIDSNGYCVGGDSKRTKKTVCTRERITERNFSFCHRLMHDAKPGCKGKPAVGRSVPEHLLRALPPTPMELISILYSAVFRLNSQKISKTHP